MTDRRRDWLPAVAGVALGVALALLLARLFTVGMAQSYDTTLYGRSLWGIAHGSGHNPVYGTHWLGIHANWVLVLLAPLTWVFSSATVLVAAQSIAFGTAASLIVAAARDAEGGTSRLGSVAVTCWSLALVASPLLVNPFLFDARPDLIAVPFMLAGLLRVERTGGWDRRALLWLICSALVREEFAVIGAGCIVLGPGARGWGWRQRVAAAAGLVAYFALYWFVVRGHFSEFAADRADQAAGDLFAGGGEGVSVFRLHLLVATAAVGGGLALRGFRWLPAAVPGLVFVAISTKLATFALNFHYPMFAAPVLVVAAIAGVRALSTNPRFLRIVWASTVLAVVAGATFGAYPGGERFQSEHFGYEESAQPWQRECHALLGSVPPDAGAAMPAMFGPRFADREHIWSIETLHRHLLEAEPSTVPTEIEWIALDNNRFATLGRVLVNQQGFQLVGIAAGRIALLRRSSGGVPPVLSIPGRNVACGHQAVSWEEAGLALCDIVRDESGRVRATITRVGPPPAGAPIPTAVVLEVNGQPTILDAFFGLLDPTTIPGGVAVPVISQDRVSAPEVRIHLQDRAGRNYAGSRLSADGMLPPELGVVWRF